MVSPKKLLSSPLWEQTVPLVDLQEADGLTSAADAVPKKRGPKTDVLEALLKRVDGLEKRLHNEAKSETQEKENRPQQESSSNSSESAKQQRPLIEIPSNAPINTPLLSPPEPRYVSSELFKPSARRESQARD